MVCIDYCALFNLVVLPVTESLKLRKHLGVMNKPVLPCIYKLTTKKYYWLGKSILKILKYSTNCKVISISINNKLLSKVRSI